MKVDFIWVTNYKSINDRNKLVVDPSVTTVIGKNESGKSNLIDIVGSISLITGLPEEQYTKTTQGIPDAELHVEVQCSFLKDELAQIGLKSSSTSSMFVIAKENSPFFVAISGGIQDYFKKDDFQSDVQYLGNAIEEYKSEIKDNNTKNNLQNLYGYLMKAFDYVIPNYSSHLTKIRANIMPFLNEEEKEIFEEVCNRINTHFSGIYNLFPVFHQYRENPLLNHYTINNDFLEKDSTQLRSLKLLLAAADCDIQDVKDACIIHPHDGIGMDAKRKIERGIRNKIENGFNEFYKQDKRVEVVVDVKPSRISIYVSTLGPAILLSERSDGLKWYLNLYIDTLANNLENKRLVFLIDEPGVFLHVDAQKKVLELFDELSRENQVIYTTHSPFMLNENRIDRIRAMVKDEAGYSDIVTSVMSEKIVRSSQSETLSPLMSALGMKLYQNLGMSDNKLNVITEGFSDAIYLDTMSRKLGIKNMKFIPSTGASNEVYLANILWGWGFPFKALFDWDKGGRDGRKAILKAYTSDIHSLEANDYEQRHIVMISDVFNETRNTNDIYTMESLINTVDYEKIGLNYSIEEMRKSGNMKNLSANRFAEAVTQENISLSQKTLDNFRILFAKLNRVVAD